MPVYAKGPCLCPLSHTYITSSKWRQQRFSFLPLDTYPLHFP